jgi:hypothetical protein
MFCSFIEGVKCKLAARLAGKHRRPQQQNIDYLATAAGLQAPAGFRVDGCSGSV